MNMNRYLHYLAGIGVALTWGLSFMFTKDALDSLSPFHLLGLRFAAAVAAMALLRAVGVIKINVSTADYVSLLPLSIFQPILYFSTETAGIMLTSASYSGMMIAAIPIFVAILSALILREKPSRLQVFFIVASVAGVVFIIFMDNQSIDGVNSLGTLALMGAVLSAACYNIASRKQSADHSPLKMTWVMMVVGAVVFNIIGLSQQLSGGTLVAYFAPLAEMWVTVLYLGVISSVGAFFLFNYVLGKVTATQGAVFVNMVPVVAVAAGVLFRGEIIYWYHLAGTAAIIGGVWGTNRFAPAPQEYKETESLTHSNA
ncbi:MAG: DMT family transporter [Dethiobacteria bacterium]|nr:DMT family transporter [Dethiobacteria bacterium]